MDLDTCPLVSVRADGSRVIGNTVQFAKDLHRAGTPPMHGLSNRDAKSARVALVCVGDRLEVEREGKRWLVRDGQETLGVLRWRPSDDGRTYPDSDVTIHLPAKGTLVVGWLVVKDGLVVDFGGHVVPA